MTPLVCLLLGVFSFGEKSPDVEWNGSGVREARPAARWEKTIAHAALAGGVWHSGPAEIDFRPPGRSFVEIFLAAEEPVAHSFALEAGGVTLDGRHTASGQPGRLRGQASARPLSLLAWVNGPTRLRVRTDARRYQLIALRWTSEAELAALLPRWLERARHLHRHPLFEGQEGGPKTRARALEQLWERVQFSPDPAARREAAIGVARAVYWQAAEDHEPHDLVRLERLLRQCLPYREDSLVRQMISAGCRSTSAPSRPMVSGELCGAVEPVRWEVNAPPAPAGAPAWAAAQRRLRLRMDAITRWWVEVRQQPNGELGGAWDDDVEILRSWAPLALGLGSPVAARGIERLADGVWNSGVLRDGYFARIRDVEHAAEPTTDTQPLLAALRPADEAVRARLRRTAACAANWIVPQPDGMWRFRGAWFNCSEFDAAPSRAVDVHMNTRAMGPLFWHAYLTRDPAAVRLLTRWAESWVRAMRSTAAGKPAGRFPSAVWSKDGGYLVDSRRWDLPNAEWDYFQWSGQSQEALTSLVLAVYELTGERRWLDAAGESFDDPDPRFRNAPQAFHHWRRLSGDARRDAFFGWKPDPAAAETLEGLRELADAMEARLSVNFEIYTSEPLFTDRIYYPLPPEYRLRLFGGEGPRGDSYPTFAVTWLPETEGYARAVLAADESTLRLRAYHFGDRPAAARFRCWRLRPGRYRWKSPAGTGEFTVAALPHAVEIPLPPRREIEIEIGPAPQNLSR